MKVHTYFRSVVDKKVQRKRDQGKQADENKSNGKKDWRKKDEIIIFNTKTKIINVPTKQFLPKF